MNNLGFSFYFGFKVSSNLLNFFPFLVFEINRQEWERRVETISLARGNEVVTVHFVVILTTCHRVEVQSRQMHFAVARVFERQSCTLLGLTLQVVE